MCEEKGNGCRKRVKNEENGNENTNEQQINFESELRLPPVPECPRREKKGLFFTLQKISINTAFLIVAYIVQSLAKILIYLPPNSVNNE